MQQEINYSIARVDAANVNTPRYNEPFSLTGHLEVRFDGKKFICREVEQDGGSKAFSTERVELDEYVGEAGRAAFLCFADGACVGHVLLTNMWNRFCMVDDIAVDAVARGKGAGHLLMNAACDWARGESMCGMVLEAQDNNLSACRFYLHYGFQPGGVNTMLYHNFNKIRNEQAISFYYLFDRENVV